MKLRRGSICLVDLNPVIGHEQAGQRPCLVVSADGFNVGKAGLVIVVPLTTTRRNIPSHIEIHPPEGGIKYNSFAMCEMVRSISKKRVVNVFGTASDAVMNSVEVHLKRLLGFSFSN